MQKLQENTCARKTLRVFGGRAVALVAGLALAQAASAAIVTNPNDARSWQGATVGTFAQLYYGSDTLANRTQVTTNQLLDDGNFNATGYTGAALIKYNNVNVVVNPGYGSYGTSLDQPGINNGVDQGTYNYSYSGIGAAFGGSTIDQHWIQTNNVVGHTVFDLGFGASKAAIFNSIDHSPLPQEAIESTVYLSNDMVNWTQAVTERVWLEGIYSDTSVVWDGFVYAVGTGTNATFRYASVIWGGPGALIADGDNEINGVMGLRGDYTPSQAVPEPETYAMLLAGLGLLGFAARRRKQKQS